MSNEEPGESMHELVLRRTGESEERFTAQMAALEERWAERRSIAFAALNALLDERDRRYGERFHQIEEDSERLSEQRDKSHRGQMDERDLRYEQELRSLREAKATAYAELSGEIVKLRQEIQLILTERDLRYEQRANAQDSAVTTALSAQEKALRAALEAADRAVAKAETASEKRFDCVTADTPVLCADLVWRSAGDLAEGDELIGVDEKSPARRGRRFRRSVVTANSLSPAALLMVRTPVGSLRCTSNHPWLVRRHEWQWVRTHDLVVGDEVLHALDPWEVETSWEAGWLAGMLDGEGCLSLNTDKSGTAQLSLAQRESPTSARMQEAMEKRVPTVGTYRVDGPNRPEHWKPQVHCVVSVRADVLKILGSIRPPRLMTMADSVWDGKPIGGKRRSTIVTSIEDDGEGQIARLSTSTATYIANGFVVHNSVNEFRQTLSDQTSTLVPRLEMQVKLDGLEAQMDRQDGRLIRLEQTGARHVGVEEGKAALWAIAVAVIAGLLAAGSIVATIVTRH